MNVYAIPSLLGLILSVSLGSYVILKDHKNNLNRIFFIFSACLFLWTLSEFMRRSYLDVASPAFWSTVENIGVIFLSPLFLNFAAFFQVATAPRILRSRYLWVVFYGIGVIFLILLLTGNLIGETTLEFWGYEYGYRPTYVLFAAYFFSLIAVSAVRLFSIFFYTKSSDLQHKNAGLLLFGGSVVVIVGGLTDIVLPLARINILPIASVGLLIFELFAAYAIVRRQMLSVPTIRRFFRPYPEAHLRTKMRYKLRNGRIYLVKEKMPSLVKELFLDLVTHGVPGLWITSQEQNEIRKYGLNTSSVLSLSNKRNYSKISLLTTDLYRLKSFVENQLDLVGEREVIVVDCFEDLVVANGLKHTIELIREIGELCSEKSSNLILRIDPMRFTKGQISLIEGGLKPFLSAV